jgi:hypothetical protein
MRLRLINFGEIVIDSNSCGNRSVFALMVSLVNFANWKVCQMQRCVRLTHRLLWRRISPGVTHPTHDHRSNCECPVMEESGLRLVMSPSGMVSKCLVGSVTSRPCD